LGVKNRYECDSLGYVLFDFSIMVACDFIYQCSRMSFLTFWFAIFNYISMLFTFFLHHYAGTCWQILHAKVKTYTISHLRLCVVWLGCAFVVLLWCCFLFWRCLSVLVLVSFCSIIVFCCASSLCCYGLVWLLFTLNSGWWVWGCCYWDVC
jgi:hypothetical protein